ncbi:MAG: PhzF family phenazine biosynthesis protein [Actinomycetes bacterium]
MSREILRYAAFPAQGAGGNPAGLVLDAAGLDAEAMLRIAAEVGYSETAFLVPTSESGVVDVRYFAPRQEVPFCGHATIAAGVALAERGGPGSFTFRTPAGPVVVGTRQSERGLVAELVSVPPETVAASPALVAEVLDVLRWSATDLDPRYPPALASAGARHLVLVSATRERLADLHYDVPAAAAIMRRDGIVTFQLVWPESPARYHARNPFAVGGVVEDPATGAAAAALGGYLRAYGFLPEDATFTVSQGVDMGSPSEIEVRLVAGEPGVRVSGTAALIACA